MAESATTAGVDGVEPRKDPPAPSLWRSPTFMRLWTAQGIGQFGDQITLLALPVTALLTLDASAFDVGLLRAVDYLPFLLIGLFAGVWVDRVPRKRVLVASDLARAALLVSIPVAYWLDALTLPHLYVVAFGAGVATVFAEVAYQSIVPALVERGELMSANSKLELARSGALLVGPATGGWVIGLLRAPGAIVVDVATFIVSAVLRLGLPERPPPPRPDAATTGGVLHQAGEGLRFLFRNRYLRGLTVATAISNLFAAMSAAVFLVYGVRELRLGLGEIGVAFAIGSLGLLVAGTLGPRIAKRLGIGPTLVWCSILPGAATILLAVARPGTALLLFVVWRICFAFGVALYNISQFSVRQAVIPNAMLGRLTGSIRTVVWGIAPVGALLGAASAVWFGLRPTIWIAALGGLLTVVPLLLSGLWSLRTLPASPDEPSAQPPQTAAAR